MFLETPLYAGGSAFMCSAEFTKVSLLVNTSATGK